MKPKILYPVIDGQISGGNIVCLQLIDEALRRGWEVAVTSPTEGPFCEQVRQRGIPVYLLDTRRSFHWGVAVKMARWMRSQGISLVHSHTSFAGTILTRLGGKIAGVPVISHAHIRDPLSPNPLIRSYQVTINRWTSRHCCAGVIAVSEQVRREVIEQGDDARKVRVIYNGIPLHLYAHPDSRDARRALGIPDHYWVVVHIGRLCETKGQHRLIQSAKKLKDEETNLLFLIVGEDLVYGGGYRRRLEEMARELGVDDRVWFMGRRSDIPRILSASDLLVLPSSAEGLPIVILEAMAAGKPVVATPVGGVPEVVVDGETGFLVPFNEVEMLSEAIGCLMRNPRKAWEMGQKGRERIRQHFTLERMLKETFRFYEQTLDQKDQ